MEHSFFNLKQTYEKLNIVTLGPKGTSSEKSATYFGNLMVQQKQAGGYLVHLCPTYEEASKKLAEKKCNVLVVANAYHGINEFYMDNTFHLSAAFLNNTPNYGIAMRKDYHQSSDANTKIRIATHPAPKALIRELLPEPYEIGDIELKNSTSAAARAVFDQEVDAALTTEDAAKLHDLVFISQIRPIQMLWSAFTL